MTQDKRSDILRSKLRPDTRQRGIMPRGGIRPSKDGSLDHLLQSKWQSGKTQTIRVPIELSQDILDYARKLDSGEVSKLSDLTQDNTEELERLKAELKEVKRERDGFDQELTDLHATNATLNNDILHLKEELAELKSKPTDPQPEPAAPALELPDAKTLLKRLQTKHILFKGKKPRCRIDDVDVQAILDLLEG